MINPDFSLAYYWDRLVTITALRSRIRFPGAEHIAFWLERRTRDRKVASSNSGKSGGRISSPDKTVCADSYSVFVPPPCYRSGT